MKRENFPAVVNTKVNKKAAKIDQGAVDGCRVIAQIAIAVLVGVPRAPQSKKSAAPIEKKRRGEKRKLVGPVEEEKERAFFSQMLAVAWRPAVFVECEQLAAVPSF